MSKGMRYMALTASQSNDIAYLSHLSAIDPTVVVAALHKSGYVPWLMPTRGLSGIRTVNPGP